MKQCLFVNNVQFPQIMNICYSLSFVVLQTELRTLCILEKVFQWVRSIPIGIL